MSGGTESGSASEAAGGSPAPPGIPARETVSRVRVGVGVLVAVVTVLVILLDALLGTREAFRAAAPGTGLLLAFLAAAAARELYALLDAAGVPSHAVYGSGATFTLLSLRALLPMAGVRSSDAAALAAVGLVLAVLIPAAQAIAVRPDAEKRPRPSAAAIRPMAGTAFGLLVVHLPMALLLEVRLVPSVGGMDSSPPPGLVLAAMAVVACKVGDSAAYFAGRTIGKRPLCWVSPKKTWEGAVAGLLAGTAAAAVVGLAGSLTIPLGLAFGLVVNLAGQGGDLLESWLKRCCGAKDSGSTFGEMGGALDLVDALLLAGPAAYLFHAVVLA